MGERTGAHVRPSEGACGIIDSAGVNRGQSPVAGSQAIPSDSEGAGVALVLSPEIQEDRLGAQGPASELRITRSVDGFFSGSRSSSVTSSSRCSQASETQATETTGYSSVSGGEIDRQSFDISDSPNNSAAVNQKRKRAKCQDRIISGASAEDPILIIDCDISEQIDDGALGHRRKKRRAARRAAETLKGYQEKEPQWMSEVLAATSYLQGGNEALTDDLRDIVEKISVMSYAVQSRDLSVISKSVYDLALCANRMLDEKKTEKEALAALRIYMERWGAREQRGGLLKRWY